MKTNCNTGLWMAGALALALLHPIQPSQALGAAPQAIPNAVADRVLGQASMTDNGPNRGGSRAANTLRVPAGIAIAPDSAPASVRGRLFIADFENFRVLSWPGVTAFASGAAADMVIGQADFASATQAATRNTLAGPEALVLDGNGNLFVADTLAHRVLLFRPPFSTGMEAARVFGQGSGGDNFTGQAANAGGVSASSANYPRGLAVDASHNLYVADDFNHRVLFFSNPTDANTANAVSADLVVGQPNLTSNSVGGFQNGLDSPKGIGVDRVNGALYVASYPDNRVLQYALPLTANQPNAARVFGQGSSGLSFNTNAAGTSATALRNPIDLAVGEDGTLYVADQLNARVLAFVDPLEANATNAVTADRVYGQGAAGTSFAASASGTSAEAMRKTEPYNSPVLGFAYDLGPLGLVANSTGLFVADAANHRVLAFDTGLTNKVVGDGTSASCTEAALTSALAGGGNISFNCGGPKMIVLTSQKTIDTDTHLNGAGQITLSGGNTTRLVLVNAGVILGLVQLTVTHGFNASGDGGAIRNDGALIINGSAFRNNATSDSWSGGAIVSYGPLTIVDSVFENNRGGNGGALYPRFSAAGTYIRNTLFQNNRTTNTSGSGWGGAMLMWDGAVTTIEHSTFISNTALNGGALYNFVNSRLLVQNSMLMGNVAITTGGAIYNEGFGTVLSSTLEANTAENGGGIYQQGNFNTPDANFINIGFSTLHKNRARSGGGVMNRYSTMSVKSSTFSQNVSTNSSGIASIDGKTTVDSVTFEGNQVAISQYATGSGRIFSLRNTILSSGGASGGNCTVGGGSVAKIDSLGTNLSSDASCNLTQATDKPNTNPLLGPLADNGGPTWTHMPPADSPVMDAGQCRTDILNPTDQRGLPQPVGAACEIGAVEYGSLKSFVYLPLVVR